MLVFSCRRYSLDKQDLSTPPLEGEQKFLPSKKNLKVASKKEFLNQGETDPSMQTNITKHPNKMTWKGDCGISAKELKKVTLGWLLREASSQVPCSVLIRWAGFWKCISILVPGQPSSQPNPTGTQECLPKECECYNWPLCEPSWKSGGAPVPGWNSQAEMSLWHELGCSSWPCLSPWKVESVTMADGSSSRRQGGMLQGDTPLQRKPKHEITDLVWNKRKSTCWLVSLNNNGPLVVERNGENQLPSCPDLPFWVWAGWDVGCPGAEMLTYSLAFLPTLGSQPTPCKTYLWLSEFLETGRPGFCGPF